MSILTPEAQVMCDAALEAGIAPPTHEDPVVCEKQLYYLALSVGTPVHDLIRRLVFNENMQVFTQWVCEKLSKRACVYVAIAAARSVLGLVPENEERPKRAIDAACKWLENPSDAAYAAASTAAADAAYSAANAAYSAVAYFAANAASYAADAASAASAASAAASAASAATRTPKDHWSRTIDFHALVLESAIFAAKEYP